MAYSRILGLICLAYVCYVNSVAANDFQERNGIMLFFNSYNGDKFVDIQARLPELKARGTRILMLYSPYHGDKEKWLGCASRDFYDVSPQNGTLADLRHLIAAAHALDIKVISYFANVYMTQDAPFFAKAAAQYAAGDRTSPEVSAIRWATDTNAPLPDQPTAAEDAELQGHWKYSSVAKAYYWSLWGEVGIDFKLAGARNELDRITKFWIEMGLDGFIWDDTHLDERFKHHLVDLPKSLAGKDLFLTFESTVGDEAAAYDQFGLTSWMTLWDDDNVNDYALVVQGEHSANDLENSLRKADFARSKGKSNHAWAALDPYANDALMRVQEAALLAGAGILYGFVDYANYIKMPATVRAGIEKVLNTVNVNAALLPSASRSRIRAGSDAKVYAMKRTSRDESQTVLLVYNFKNRATDVTLDLSGSGISTRQTPLDVYNGGAAEAITGNRYRIRLPAYGFRFLQVALDQSKQAGS